MEVEAEQTQNIADSLRKLWAGRIFLLNPLLDFKTAS